MIPKFSIRQMLLGMVAIGVLSMCFAGAFRGSQVALGLSVGIVGTVLPFLVYAVVHWGCFAPAKLSALLSGRVAGRASSAVEQVPVCNNPESPVVSSDNPEQGALDD